MQLIYCAGKNQRFEAVAYAAGFQIGVQLPNTVHHPVFFADQNWKRPNRVAYMAALAQHRPQMATVLDWERTNQLSEILDWAAEAAQYVEQILIIPKVRGGIGRLPRHINGKQVVLAYSVPTAYGGTPNDGWEFQDWPIHLLGGGPHQQMFLSCFFHGVQELPSWFSPRARRLYDRMRMFGGFATVISTDGNMANKMAHRGRFWSQEKGPKGHWRNLREIGVDLETDNNLEAFRRSCVNIKAAWGKL